MTDRRGEEQMENYLSWGGWEGAARWLFAPPARMGPLFYHCATTITTITIIASRFVQRDSFPPGFPSTRSLRSMPTALPTNHPQCYHYSPRSAEISGDREPAVALVLSVCAIQAGFVLTSQRCKFLSQEVREKRAFLVAPPRAVKRSVILI